MIWTTMVILQWMKILLPHNVRVVHKGLTVKLGPVVPEFQCIFREAKSQKYLSMKTAVGAMQPAKMLTMMRKANLSIMTVIGLNEDEEGLTQTQGCWQGS